MSSAEIERLNAALGDRYRIERELGVGGMATVYLARDVRHDRPVAVKVLRPDLAAVIGVERFLDEIKTTAHLQHAHILGLIDSGQVNGTVFYVMPFVDGESLRARLTREKQIPVPDAVRIATAVAGALDYAHRRGVIHRDIKPENILLHEGQPLVADFGIALAVTRSDSRARVTEAGTSLGTPQYMSPEQAAGERNLDARTDVYSLGCVLYEMLTGEPPFSGPSAQAIIAKVMSVEPEPVTTLRRSVPPNVAAATMTALSKVPADRFASAAEFAAALANPQYVGAALAARRAASAWSRLSGRDIAAFVVIAALAIVAAIGWLRTGGGATAPGVVRFEIPVPDSVLHNQQIGVSRDGSRILWADASGYWERRLDDTAIRRIRETEATQATPTLRGISPDGREVLVSGGGGLAIVPLGTGPGRTLAAGGRGGTWGGDGAIYSTAQGGFSISAPRWLLRITPQTGAVDTLGALPDSSSVNEMVALPDGRALLVAMNRSGQAQLRAFDVRAKTWHMLDEAGGLRVQYLDAGYVIYTRGQYLMAAPLDRGRLEFAQPAMPIAEAASGAFDKLAAAGDVLAYAPAPDPQATRDIAIRSRSGVTRILPNINDTAVFSAFAIAPDGRRIVATGTPQRGQGPGAQGPSNVYVYQLPSGPLTRLRSSARDVSPAWLPGGREVSFVRIAGDTSTLMRQSWDGANPPARVLSHVHLAARGNEFGGGRGADLGATSWFPDGRGGVIQLGTGRGGAPGARGAARGAATVARGQAGAVAPQQAAGGRGAAPDLARLMLFSANPRDSLKPLVMADSVSATNPALSADGRLLAYVANENGRSEVYVRPLDGSLLRKASLAGGTGPRWGHDGVTLFFRNADTLYSAKVRWGNDLVVSDVAPVMSGFPTTGYAVLPGDTAFVTRGTSTITSVPLHVVVNASRELERLFAKQ